MHFLRVIYQTLKCMRVIVAEIFMLKKMSEKMSFSNSQWDDKAISPSIILRFRSIDTIYFLTFINFVAVLSNLKLFKA